MSPLHTIRYVRYHMQVDNRSLVPFAKSSGYANLLMVSSSQLSSVMLPNSMNLSFDRYFLKVIASYNRHGGVQRWDECALRSVGKSDV